MIFTLKIFNIYAYSCIHIHLHFFCCAGSLFLCTGFLQLQRAGDTLQVQCTGFSLWGPLLLQSRAPGRVAFSSCGAWAQQVWFTVSRAQAQQLWFRAQLLLGAWDLLGPGIEPVSSTLTGRFFFYFFGRQILYN